MQCLPGISKRILDMAAVFGIAIKVRDYLEVRQCRGSPSEWILDGRSNASSTHLGDGRCAGRALVRQSSLRASRTGGGASALPAGVEQVENSERITFPKDGERQKSSL
jgi:hypothetical protein